MGSYIYEEEKFTLLHTTEAKSVDKVTTMKIREIHYSNSSSIVV